MDLKAAGLAGVLATGTLAQAQAAPRELYDKAIRLSWSESRIQRDAGQTQFRNVNNVVQQTFYISSAGRVFARSTRASDGGRRRGGRGGAISSSADRGPGEMSRGVAAGGIRFQDRRMTVTSGYQSGARQIVVDFASDYSTCSARVVLGKEGGRNLRQISQNSGNQIEVQSVEVSAATCAVAVGNPFAN